MVEYWNSAFITLLLHQNLPSPSKVHETFTYQNPDLLLAWLFHNIWHCLPFFLSVSSMPQLCVDFQIGVPSRSCSPELQTQMFMLHLQEDVLVVILWFLSSGTSHTHYCNYLMSVWFSVIFSVPKTGVQWIFV